MSRLARDGSFRTLPDSEEYIDSELNPQGLFNFSFEFACGNNQNLGHSIGPGLPTFGTMLNHIADDINFAILNGDWLYESQREFRRTNGVLRSIAPARDTARCTAGPHDRRCLGELQALFSPGPQSRRAGTARYRRFSRPTITRC